MITCYFNPHDARCRNIVNSLNGNYDVIVDYTHYTADRTVWISFLPTIVLTDNDGNELARIEHADDVTQDNINWLRSTFASWTSGTPFPTPPWEESNI